MIQFNALLIAFLVVFIFQILFQIFLSLLNVNHLRRQKIMFHVFFKVPSIKKNLQKLLRIQQTLPDLALLKDYLIRWYCLSFY